MQATNGRPYYYCKRLRLLDYLIRKGFRAVGTMPDFNNPSYKVWKFENSPELEAALAEYFAERAGNER
jgi:hypothetical protein